MVNILVIGSGAREHAITCKLAQSPGVRKLYVAPGNAGTASIADNVPVKAEDITALRHFALNNSIDLTIVGPEGPLAAGIVDAFQQSNLKIFGPSRNAAEIESSKVFSRSLMERHGIPCAAGKSFVDYDEALAYLQTRRLPVVLKADGLAAGKGVIIATTLLEAQQTLTAMMQEKCFGQAGSRIVVEDYLEGKEMSFFVFTDGKSALPTVPACDYKRIFEGNKGPNTGGMGSYSPPPFFTPLLGETIMSSIMKPVIKALAEEGRPYRGVLYGGLMIKDNSPYVIEFNARLGDPETQVVLPRMKTDLLEVIEATIENRLGDITIEWRNEACVGVVLASGGYPGEYKTGFPITGLSDVDDDIIIFHAGTRLGPSGEALTSGGRVLTVVALGANLAEARAKVYRNVPKIRFQDVQYRRDIADIYTE